MIAKFLLAIVLFVLGASPIAPVFAETAEPLDPPPTVIISEVYPDTVGSDSDDESGEFIEIHNTTDEEVSLEAFYLRIITTGSGTEYYVNLNKFLYLEPDEYLAIRDMIDDDTTFLLSNTGATVELVALLIDDTELILDSITYSKDNGDVDEDFSISLIGDSWQLAEPTPGQANPAPPEDTGETPNEEPPQEELPEEPEEGTAPPDETVEPACNISGVSINEVLANPAGSDKNGGEFVELYNSGTETLSLAGCLLTTDKLANYELPSAEIEANGFYAVELADDLLNGGGAVVFITHSEEDVVEYLELKDDEAWALIENVWQTTKRPTPGSANLATLEEEENESDDSSSLEPCPEGKFRNPETNRCKNIVDTASSLIPCAANQVRNPETNRCRKISSATSGLKPCSVGQVRNPATNRCRKTTSSGSTLKPCNPDQERNPATNRCRKITSGTSSLVPCEEDYERNPETNRCRKSTSGNVAGAATFPVSEPAPLRPGILIGAAALAIGYGLYEYRLDFANWRHKFKNFLQNK